jgi:hypothetical protein
MSRGQRTLAAMLRIYCTGRHRTAEGLCADCAALEAYATRRLAKCVFGDEKPVCAKCPIHCYRPAMRERIRDVMRYSGPKMLYRHPALAIGHLLDKRKPAPRVPNRRRSSSAVPGSQQPKDQRA